MEKNYTKWEYKTITIKFGLLSNLSKVETDLNVTLNALGNDGWELVTCQLPGQYADYCVCVLKRPMMED